MNKKQAARFEMLKALSKNKSKEMHEPSVGEKLKAKKLKKVEVIADTDENLKKGLSKAQQILKAKLGEKLGKEDEEEDEEYSCPVCEKKGCEECEEEEEDEEADD